MKNWMSRRYWGFTLIVGGFKTNNRDQMQSGLEIFFNVHLGYSDDMLGPRRG